MKAISSGLTGGYKKQFEELRLKYELEIELLKSNIVTNRLTKKSNAIQIIIAIIVAIFVGVSTLYQVKTYRTQVLLNESDNNIKEAMNALNKKVNDIETNITNPKNVKDTMNKK